MSSPMMASCRPTCPMVLEEWEPELNLDCTPASEATCTGWEDAFLLYLSELRKLSPQYPPSRPSSTTPHTCSPVPSPFSSLLGLGHSPDLLCEPSTEGVFPGRDCFTFSLHPFIPTPPKAASISLLGKYTSSHPCRRCNSCNSTGPGTKHSHCLLSGRTGVPSPPSSCLWPGAIFKSAPGQEVSRRGGGEHSTPPLTGGREKKEGRRQTLPSFSPACQQETDLCLAQPHPCCSFRKKMPFPLPWSHAPHPPANPAPPGQQDRRMLTAPPTPSTATQGGHSWGVGGGVRAVPRARGLCRPGPTPALIQVAFISLTSWGSQEVLGNVSKKEKREEKEEAVGEASGDTRTSDRGHFAQALEVKQGCPQRAMGPPEVSPKTFTREEEKECLLDGDFRLASLKVGATPWNRLLTLYKQLQKSAMAKFPLKEGLPDEKSKEEEMEVEDSSFKLCVPGIVTLQSPLHKTFRSTDTVGFVESELKKLLAVQRDSRLWKVGSHDGQELLTEPEITLEEAGIVNGQVGNEMENREERLIRLEPQLQCRQGHVTTDRSHASVNLRFLHL
ncbi:gametogenetin-binding protein 1-like isoform X2 [Mustela nigripes]|uniref:gametogenetin-binding protein 1-like isoform X2 n=1 Tax=Mustela nigripes TaxID=77151 RepID=UPI00281646E5|nr:gametogenetin-binding protein 1-like isoform X2 [Mustela nigripes]